MRNRPLKTRLAAVKEPLSCLAIYSVRAEMICSPAENGSFLPVQSVITIATCRSRPRSTGWWRRWRRGGTGRRTAHHGHPFRNRRGPCGESGLGVTCGLGGNRSDVDAMDFQGLETVLLHSSEGSPRLTPESSRPRAPCRRWVGGLGWVGQWVVSEPFGWVDGRVGRPIYIGRPPIHPSPDSLPFHFIESSDPSIGDMLSLSSSL
jgi:hypothetical protein